MARFLLNRYYNGKSVDEIDRVPSNIKISNREIVFYIIGIVLYFYDLTTDINLCVKYYTTHRMPEFYWTLAFLIVPMIVIFCVSLSCYYSDQTRVKGENNTEINYATSTLHCNIRIFMLLLQMTVIWRTIESFYFAIKSRKAGDRNKVPEQRRYYELMLSEDADIALLRIFKCYLESSPQMVLQITILLIQRSEHLKLFQMMSILASLGSMAWCEVAYQRSIRYTQRHKYNMDWWGSGFQFIWHFMFTLSRVMSLAAAASLSPKYTVVACSLHILLMSLWNQFGDRSPFCSENKIGEVAFSCAFGAVYLFNYVLSKDVETRYRYLAYYTLFCIENTACAVLWSVYSHEVKIEYFILMLILIIVTFIVGLLVMCLYYWKFHPNRRQCRAQPRVDRAEETVM